MKQAKSAARSPAARRKTTPNTVAEYLASVPEQSRKTFLELRKAVRAAVPPDAVEIISYRIPAFKDERVLVWFAAFSKHCSLFPTASILRNFKDELTAFPVSKGTVQFPIDEALPTALIKKMVKARVAEAKGS